MSVECDQEVSSFIYISQTRTLGKNKCSVYKIQGIKYLEAMSAMFQVGIRNRPLE